jgi:electron transfer flavoprotein alpha subunit
MSQLEAYKDVWVYVRNEGEEITEESRELLAAGRKVAERLKQRVVAVLVGYRLERASESALEWGADRVISVDDPAFQDQLNLSYIDALHRLAKERKPYVFLFSSDETGKDLAPRLAYRLKTGLATDNIELEVGDFTNPRLGETYHDLLIQIRPDFGTRVAKIFTPKCRPQMATVRQGCFVPQRRVQGAPLAAGQIERVDYRDGRSYRALVRELKELPRPERDLRRAQVVISLGLGVLKDGKGNPRNPREAYDLAAELRDIISNYLGLRAEIGASRALLYAEIKELKGLITSECQVGQTGVTVSPDVYFALGISGAVQHRVGMQKSKKIVAVNIDPHAPIFQIAHYPIVADLYEFLPQMLSSMKRYVDSA